MLSIFFLMLTWVNIICKVICATRGYFFKFKSYEAFCVILALTSVVMVIMCHIEKGQTHQIIETLR